MKKFLSRVFSMLIGTSLYAIGLVLTIKANIGYGPWEVFHAGLGSKFGVGIGVASVFVSIVIVIIVTLCGEKFGIGTIAGMIITGLLIDVIIWINIIPTPDNFWLGSAMLISGLFIVALGSYFYIRSALGIGPRDNLMVVLTRKTKWPVGVCRGIVEITVTLIGWLLGGKVGVGTIISMLAIGFCIQITFRVLRFDVTAVSHETLRGTYSALIAKKREHKKERNAS